MNTGVMTPLYILDKDGNPKENYWVCKNCSELNPIRHTDVTELGTSEILIRTCRRCKQEVWIDICWGLG